MAAPPQHWRRHPDVVRCRELSRFPQPGTPVDVAVSGGADSLALLALAVAHDLVVTAHHVDHQIRPNSSAESPLVAEAAEGVGARFVSHAVKVEPGPNLEARARHARYLALPPTVLTGHTADDRAETIVANLLRGASLDGLVGMRPLGGPSGTVGHPLLALRRSDTEAVCAALGWSPFHDPSNADQSLLRNHIRHDLLPRLNDAAGRDLVPVLVRQADLALADSDLLDELAAQIDPTDCRALSTAPEPLARRAVRRWLTRTHPPDLASINRVLAVARGEAVACEIPGGGRVSRTNMRLTSTFPLARD